MRNGIKWLFKVLSVKGKLSLANPCPCGIMMSDGFKEGFGMEDKQSVLSINEKKLNFLYKKCSMTYFCMNIWLTIPEFVEQINDLHNKGSEINDSVVLPIIEQIYNEKDLNRSVNKDFPFQNARRGINQIRKALSVE